MSISRIRTNMGALGALKSLTDVNRMLMLHSKRLATGKRITNAGDDPAGLTIATRFNARAISLGQSVDNVGSAKNMLSVAEGALQGIKDILVEMRKKAVEAANDTLGSQERSDIQSQLNAFGEEIDAIVAQTKWSDIQLLTAHSDGFTFQVGADSTDQLNVVISSVDLTSNNLGAGGIASISVSSATNASAAIASLDAALSSVSAALQRVGVAMSRLDIKEKNLETSQINTTAAYSRIMDADMAYEQLESTKLQILQQTATAMLAQSNAAPQFVLSLFR